MGKPRPLGCGRFAEEEWAELIAAAGPGGPRSDESLALLHGKSDTDAPGEAGQSLKSAPRPADRADGRAIGETAAGDAAIRAMLEHVRDCAACGAELAAFTRLSKQVRLVLSEADATLHSAVRDAFVEGVVAQVRRARAAKGAGAYGLEPPASSTGPGERPGSDGPTTPHRRERDDFGKASSRRPKRLGKTMYRARWPAWAAAAAIILVAVLAGGLPWATWLTPEHMRSTGQVWPDGTILSVKDAGTARASGLTTAGVVRAASGAPETVSFFSARTPGPSDNSRPAGADPSLARDRNAKADPGSEAPRPSAVEPFSAESDVPNPFATPSSVEDGATGPLAAPFSAEVDAVDPLAAPFSAEADAVDPLAAPFSAEGDAVDPLAAPFSAEGDATDPFPAPEPEPGAPLRIPNGFVSAVSGAPAESEEGVSDP